MPGINDVAAAVGKQPTQGFRGEFGVSINSPDPSVYHNGMVSGSNNDPSFVAVGAPGPTPPRIGAVTIPSRNYRPPGWVNEPSPVVVNPGLEDGLLGTTPAPPAPEAAPAAPQPAAASAPPAVAASSGPSSRFSLSGSPAGIRTKFAQTPQQAGGEVQAAAPPPVTNPTHKVIFDLPGFGEMAAWYHSVIYQKASADNVPSLLVLVLDSRFQGPSYFPPVSPEAIGVGYGKAEFLVHSPGILYNSGNDRHCVLLVENLRIEE